MKTCYVAALALAIAVVSCKQDKRTGDIITKKPVAEVHKTIQKTGDYSQTRHVNWLGNDYSIVVQRMADISSTVVDDGSGNKYYNNKIIVRILRKDGTEFFKREFVKSDFSSYIDDSYNHKGVLLGVVFDRAEGDNMYFAASIGSPDRLSDEYVPLVVKISRAGHASILKDTQLDTGSEQQKSDDEEMSED
ncbi:MAG: DUF4738 domain-containing protein [Prevotella sp.]|jgi:hypothetical protein|nr:DUF4738 domain-containing protein [Prevotella sp.]MBP8686300.1 DUF4738 domain-containing protein [Prevotella sp.]MBP8934811.1 DUF4738 domain-containing protein [Prevotella sp.]MBP9981930.1 DUF4738 domain-containing protein [Prevotella sp.]